MATQFNLPTTTNVLGNRPQATINARDLHQRLGVGKEFANWIKDRIAQYGFVEGEEFLPILAKMEKSKTYGAFGLGRPKTEYFLSLEMAKELAMLENNPQGRAVRRALIELERQFREDVPAMLRRLEAKNVALERELLAARPEWQRIHHYRALGLSTAETGKLLERSAQFVRDHLKRMTRCGLADYRPNPRLAAQAQKMRLAKQEGGRQ